MSSESSKATSLKQKAIHEFEQFVGISEFQVILGALFGRCSPTTSKFEKSSRDTLIKREPPLWCGYVSQKLAESKPPGLRRFGIRAGRLSLQRPNLEFTVLSLVELHSLVHIVHPVAQDQWWPAVESEAEQGSTAKAACTLERFCPRLSMAPVLAIVKMVAVLS